MDALVDSLPRWIAGVLFLATFVVAWRWPRARRAMSAVRSGLARRFRPKLPALHVVPQPLDPERPEDYAGAVAVDSAGTPLGTRSEDEYGRSEA